MKLRTNCYILVGSGFCSVAHYEDFDTSRVSLAIQNNVTAIAEGQEIKEIQRNTHVALV